VSLRAKILLFAVATIGAIASLILASVAALSDGQIRDSVRRDVQAAGALLARVLQDQGSRLRDSSKVATSFTAWKDLVMTGDRATVDDYANDLRKQLEADGIVVIDRKGKTLGAAPPEAATPDTSLAEGIRSALKGEPYLGLIAASGHIRLVASTPVFVGGYVWGAMATYCELDQEDARHLKSALGTDLAFLADGKVVGASISTPSTLPMPKGDPVKIELDGGTYLSLFANIPGAANADTGFLILRRYDAAFAPFAQFRNALGLVLAGALLLALIAGWMLGHGLTKPLGGIVRAAQAIRAGQWPSPFGTERQDEIGILQSAFDQMTSAVKAQQERLLALLDLDPLTELLNHRKFQERVEEETESASASGNALSLVLLDIDRFHDFNLRNGHAGGDRALAAAARALTLSAPADAVLARFGGEEFALLLPGRTVAEAALIAEGLRVSVREGTLESVGEALTVSAGCSEVGPQTAKAAEFVLAAELALTRAKQLGRDQVCRFEPMSEGDAGEHPFALQKFLQDGSFSTIQALAAAVDAKDPYTKGHSQRVARYAADLAAYLGMPESEVELIHMTGTLHDVGKIGVPDAILQKPARLTDEERAVIETHPVLGEVIVRKAPQLAATLPGVRHHHERWDGKGYPDGLAGERIPLMARILAVADTFDAMTSDRPYRSGMSVDEALEEIERQAGTQFEARLALMFVELMRGKAAAGEERLDLAA